MPRIYARSRLYEFGVWTVWELEKVLGPSTLVTSAFSFVIIQLASLLYSIDIAIINAINVQLTIK